MMRQKYPTRRFLIRSEVQKKAVCQAVGHLPEDAEKPIEVVIREQQNRRKTDQNALMWAGALRDISEQVYTDGRTYDSETWHEFFKRKFLPEEFDDELTKEGYEKWAYLPDGDRVLKGSTTQLTVKGFAWYLEQIYAFGAEYGVMFGERG